MILSGCNSEPSPAPDPSESAQASDAGDVVSDVGPASFASDEVVPLDSSTGEATDGVAELDFSALDERDDPERLLRFYTNAIRMGDWENATKAWSLDSMMVPAKLRSEFGGVPGPNVAVGRGDSTKAAGTLFYVAPVTINFPDSRPTRRGTIVLQRANDVPGASALQLVWRIKRSTITP